MLGEVLAGRYELQRVLGTGGMATVFSARDTVLERTVALKVLHEQHSADGDSVARFENEARAAARLTHPNIVAVMDRGEQDGRRFIVFEHVDGETLKHVVVREGQLPFDWILRIGEGIARALAFAHANGVVHRDVKPQNVLLDANGRVKVTDFGIARTSTASGHTETGTILGTGSYIAPEQARGERAGPASDVYGLGIVLYELITGAPPYEGESFVAVAMRHVNDPVPDVRAARPDCPPGLATLIERCLAKAPSERPSAAELATALRAASRGQTVDDGGDDGAPGEQTLVISRRPPSRKRRRPRRVALLLAAVALLAAAAVATVVLTGGGAESRPVAVDAIATFDPPPEGDGSERDDTVALATDGDPSTFWTSERYFSGFEKAGVGLVLDAGSATALSQMTVTTDLPGWTAEIRAGSSATDFSAAAVVGDSRTTARTTTWELDSEPARYYLIWITAMATDGEGNEVAQVNEVAAAARS